MKKHVGIIGGGFAGLYTAIYLRRFYTKKELTITLFDKKESFVFTPLLHEVFTGNLPLDLVSIPFSLLLEKYHFTFNHEHVRRVDPHTNTIISSSSHSFDFLVLSTGSKTPVPLSPHPHLYDVKSSLTLCKDIQQHIPQSVVVVGAGATGVETACELSYLLYKKLGLAPSSTSLHLLSSTPSILPSFSPYIQRKALLSLKKQHIHLHLNTKALSIDRTGILTETGYLPADSIVWAAGITPLAPSPFNGEKRIRTSSRLHVSEHPSFFVLGDVACIPHKEFRCVPPLAQSALQEASYVARAIRASLQKKSLPPFQYKHRATLLSLGPGKAVGEIYGIRIYGVYAWWIWRTIYLFKIPLLRKKCSVAWQWSTYIFRMRSIRG